MSPISEGKSSQPETMKKSAKIKFAQSKRNPPEHSLPAREKKNHWNKQHFDIDKVKVVSCLPTPFLHKLKTPIHPPPPHPLKSEMEGEMMLIWEGKYMIVE